MYQSEQFNQDIFPGQVKLLAEVAGEEGYEPEWLDRWSGYLFRINGKLFGYGKIAKFPLNTATSRSICRDKAFSYILLDEAGVKVPEGDYFFRLDENYRQYSRNKGIDEAKVFANHMGYPVFVKPNSLSMGKLCRKIYDENDLADHLNDIFEIDYVVLVQRVIKGREYRVVVLDNEIILCYEKSPPLVQGDGQTKLRLLLEEVKNARSGDLEVDWEMLTKKGYNPESILKENEELVLKDTANLNSGGWVVEVVRNYPEKLVQFVREVVKVMGVRFCGIDIMCDDLYQVGEYTVLEVNADPGFEAFMGYDRHMTKEVFRKILNTCLIQ